MSEYLAPGVFVEETSFRHKSIEGVGTSVAALVGPTRTGPLRGAPEAVTSFAEFERIYGDLSDLSFSDQGAQTNYTAQAARAFFDNGGKQLFVARTVNGVNDSDEHGDGSSAARASKASADGVVSFQSRFPGAQGNYTLEVVWRDSVNLFGVEKTTTPRDGEILLLRAEGLTTDARDSGAQLTASSLKYPISIVALVESQGANMALVNGEITDKNGAIVKISGTDNLLIKAKLPAGSLTRIAVRQPASGALAVGDSVELSLRSEQDISKYSGADHWGSLKTLRGSLAAIPPGGAINALHLPMSLNTGLGKDLDIPLAALAAIAAGELSMMVRRTFDLQVRKGGANGEVLCSRSQLTTARAQPNSLNAAFPADPAKREDQLTLPISCALAASGDVLSALSSLFAPDPINTPDPLTGARYLITLSGGADGKAPNAADYAGETDELAGSAGLAAFETVEDISIVMAPAAAADENNHVAVIMEMQKHCRKMRYRIGIADSRQGMSLGEVRALRDNFDDSRLALYHPWVQVSDPAKPGQTLLLPPAGFIAGVYARTDVDRGVHKAPANEVVMGALGFEQEINMFQQELLNPNGVNCLRSFAGRGHRVWGGRTLSSDPEWKYVNIRRYFLYLERSIEKSTQWAVFEPNGEALWDNIRGSVEDFLFNEWKGNRLLGGTPKEAYFVRCDRSTMTQNDLDNGRMVCVVGVAALTPAEFVIFRIGQKTADA